MHAVSPVMPGEDFEELIVAENQPEYENLPCIQMQGGVILTRWKLSEDEIKTVQETGDIYLFMWGRPVKPLMLQVEKPLLEKPKAEEAAEVSQRMDFITCVRFTEERLRNAKAHGINVSKDKCSGCGEDVLISDGSRLEMSQRPEMIIVCLECIAEHKAANPGMEHFILPETQKEVTQVLENILKNKK